MSTAPATTNGQKTNPPKPAGAKPAQAKPAGATPAKEKVARTPRPKARAYKESPAGHFVDVINSHIKALDKTKTKVSKWDGNIGAAMARGIAGLIGAAEALETKATEGFKPEVKKGGFRGINVYVSIGYKAETDGNQVPVRLVSGSITSAFLGRVSRKWLSLSPVKAAE
jgi:hypothetical protein